jgi:hypothetical protein
LYGKQSSGFTMLAIMMDVDVVQSIEELIGVGG